MSPFFSNSIPFIYSRGWQTFSVRDQILNILDDVSHTISVSTIQLCLCSAKTAIDNSKCVGVTTFQKNLIY